MERKKKFFNALTDKFDERELHSLWRILYEDLFSSKGYEDLDLAISQLKNDVPIQHITGIQYFYGKIFKVSDQVLIPRPETEELVLWILTEHDKQALSVLDLGTGSGCIATILKLFRPNWQVAGMDISSSALDVAKENGNNLSADVNWKHGDMTKAQDYPMPRDIVVCNPPYVLTSDREMMSDTVKRFEPASALFVDDSDPLFFYREVMNNIKSLAINTVELYFEIHENYGDQLINLCSEVGMQQSELRKDLQGKTRMLKTRWDV